MSKLIEQNPPKKSRFLKYSLLASISVGAIIAAPFEGMASATSEFDGVISEGRLDNKVVHSKSNVGKTRKTQGVRRKTVVGTVNLDLNNDLNLTEDFNKFFVSSNETATQNTYSSEPTEQTPKKAEIVITESTSASSGSDISVTAPSSPNNTLLSTPQSPEHVYKTPPTTPGTPYEKTPESKPNVGVNKTPPKPGIAVDLSKKWEQEKRVAQTKPTILPKPSLPTKKSSTEVAAEMVSNISRVNETIGIKLDEVGSTIKNTLGKKNKKPLQKQQKQLISSQKTTQKLKSEAEKIAEQIKTIAEANNKLYDNNRGVTSDSERKKNKLQIGKNIGKIEKLVKELESKKSEAKKLGSKIDTSANKVVLTKPEIKAPATTISTQPTPFQLQQQAVNKVQQGVFDKNQEAVNNENIAAEKTKKQLKKERQKQQRAENARKEENQQKEEAQKIVNIRSDIKQTMQQISNTNTTPNKLQELELKVKTIEDKEQKQLSKLKKQEKDIKKVAGKAQEVAEKAAKETSITKLKKLQTEMDGYLATVINSNIGIEANIKSIEILVPTSSTPPSTANIPTKQQSNAAPVMPLTPGVQGILNNQEYGGYLVPNPAQQESYLEVLSPQQAEQQPASFDSGFESLPSGTLGKETDEDAGFGQGWENVPHTQTSNVNSLPKNNSVLNTQQVLHQQRSKVPGHSNPYVAQTSTYPKDIYEIQASQYINMLRNTQPNQSNQGQINVVIDSLVTEMTKLNRDQFSQKLDKIAHLTSIKAYESLFLKLSKIQQAKVQEAQAVVNQANISQFYLEKARDILMQEVKNLDLLQQLNLSQQKLNKDTDNLLTNVQAMLNSPSSLSSAEHETVLSRSSSAESLRSDKNWESPIPSSARLEFDKKQSEYLDLGSSAFDLSKLDTEAKLQKVKNAKEFTEEQYVTLRAQNPNAPKLEELAIEHIELQKKQLQLEQEIGPIYTPVSFLNDKGHSAPNPVLSRSSSASSLSSFDDKDLWDNTGDIGVGQYEDEDSCSTPDLKKGFDGYITNDPTTSIENKIALLRTHQMAVTVKRQGLEQLLSTSSEVDQIAQQIEELKKEEVIMHNAINACLADPSKLNDVSFEEINEGLEQYNAGFSKAPISDSVESISDLVGSKENLDKEFAKLAKNEGLDNESASDLSVSDEEQEDEEVTESAIQESGKRLLPAPSNEYALSDCREKECLAGDGGGDDDNDSGIDSESEDKAIKQLSDSSEDNLKATEVDAAITLKQEAMEEVKKDIAATAPTLNQGFKVVKNVGNLINARFDTAAVGAGDEEETRIKRGLWVRGMYGINNQGRVENINGYRGINKGATIGFDVEIDNNIVGIAYSNVHSVFKFKNSKNNDKEIIDSHVVSIYGQKELPKDFALQALISASKNFIKDKTTYSYGDSKIKSNVKHRNHSYNAEALLNYNYLVKNNLVITPNIGLRYGKSRDGVYNETGINVQEIALTMKENNIFSGIVGTKVKVPLKDVLKFNNLGLTFQGAVEHNFKEKTQRINRVVKIFDTEFKQDYAIPKQPKTSYNLGSGITGSIKNTTISLDYNYYLNKHYRSHQGSVKLKVNL